MLVAGWTDQDSITERLEDLGIVFADAEHVIDAVAASAEDARCSASGRAATAARAPAHHRPGRQPVEWSDDRYLGTATAFSVRNSVAVNALSRTPPPGS